MRIIKHALQNISACFAGLDYCNMRSSNLNLFYELLSSHRDTRHRMVSLTKTNKVHLKYHIAYTRHYVCNSHIILICLSYMIIPPLCHLNHQRLVATQYVNHLRT